ncbi:hypothetical protein EN35_35750 [Rhodococcus qingshengii]|nr:hypothetical protein EN35_35750 [Rhodococcus qingshengii]
MNSGATNFLADRIGEAQHRMLGAAVRRQTGAREFACKRSDVDDVSTSARKHPSQCELGSRDHAEDVDLDDASGHGVVLVDDPSDRHDARIVDQHVDRAEFTFDGVEEVEERGGVGDVEAPERADAQILGCSRESGFVDVADRDRRTQLISRFAVAYPMPRAPPVMTTT